MTNYNEAIPGKTNERYDVCNGREIKSILQQTVKGSDHSGYNIVTQQRCQNLLLSFGFKIDAT